MVDSKRLSLEELEEYRYGQTTVTAGVPYDPEKCGYEVWPALHLGDTPYQCKNKVKDGRLYCLKHLKVFEG